MAEFDLVVVGAGPAGIAGASAAASAGRRVVVLDESPRPGGQVWRHLGKEPPAAARPWLRRLASSGAEVRSGVAVVDLLRETAGSFALTCRSAAGAQVVRGRSMLLATGARERFLPFPGWTLPGVIGVGGAHALLESGVDFCGKRVVLGGSGPLLLSVAAGLERAGARVVLVAEQAPRGRVLRFGAGLWRAPAKLWEAGRYRLQARRAPYRLGSWVTRAIGEHRLEGVEAVVRGETRFFACDLLCTGYGLVPDLTLPRLLGCAVEGGAVQVDPLQRTSIEGVWCAGESTGIGGAEAALLEGRIAGLAAGGRVQEAEALGRRRLRARQFSRLLEETFRPRPELRELAESETIVCRCEDVCIGALDPGWDGRQAKLYTRLGMGACQGRVCGPAVQHLFDWSPGVGRIPASVATVNVLADAGEA